MSTVEEDCRVLCRDIVWQGDTTTIYQTEGQCGEMVTLLELWAHLYLLKYERCFLDPLFIIVTSALNYTLLGITHFS